MLNLLTALSVLGALVTIFFYTPEEATQGVVQKIFYIHVSSAITMYVGFFLSFLSALMYLIERKLHWDEICVSASEVGFFFCTTVLLTGPVWAKPIWGTWWTWDPRLTTTFLLWLLYAGYLLLRGYLLEPSRRATITSVVAIVAFLDVPLIHFSVRLWRGIHPSVIGPTGEGIPPSMKLTLIITLSATLMLFFSLFFTRLRLERTRNDLAKLTFLKGEKS